MGNFNGNMKSKIGNVYQMIEKLHRDFEQLGNKTSQLETNNSKMAN